MKVLLINPPIEDFFFTPQRAYPIGLLYLGTVLKEEGFNVKIINCLSEYKKKTLKLPEEFSYLKRYYHPNISPFKLFSHYYRFGLDYDEIQNRIREYRPDIIGVSSNFSAYFDSSLEVCRIAKCLDKGITTILGGRVPTQTPELALNNKYVDFLLRGEAEYGLLNLCRDIKRGKVRKRKGLCYKNPDGKRHISKSVLLVNDLNKLPIIDRSLINYKNYRFKGNLSASILTSRGCNMGCSFCAINEEFRYRSADNVIKELEDCYSLGIRHFNFEDDNINFNPDFEKILDFIIEGFKGEIKISFMNGILSLGINRTLREKLVRAGLTHLDLSVASCNKSLRDKMHRREDTKTIFSLSKFLAKNNIPTTAHFIVGFPGQRFSDAIKDIRSLAKKRVFLGPSIFYPVAESKMYRSLKEAVPSLEKDYIFYRSSVAYYDGAISRDRIFLIFYLSRIINFVKELLYSPHSKEKSDSFTLGMVLLKRLFNEKKIYSIQKKQIDGKMCYNFKEETFASPQDIKRILNGLDIK
ncbi:MAG: B12-binding domain-containing radical SAM protein [Candidatus Omnitrophica bacterium]|nr:B12-binding domain-containing radical SAM protein [Candidatus Omnitrophota bacterium]